jgi:tetratricopeptide (TPR) repeat protein
MMNIAVILMAITFANSGIGLLDQADQLREKGESLKSIQLYDEAIVEAVHHHNNSMLIGALTGRLLAWKHLFYKTHDRTYALLVKKEAEAMTKIAEEKGLKERHLFHYLSATADNLLQDYPSAEKELKLAVEHYPLNNAEKGDWVAHLGEALYLNGKKKEGIETTLKGIEIIQSHAEGVDPFLIHVWLSGAYLRLATLLKTDNLQESKSYLEKAKKIIQSDDRLVIRKQQLEELESTP